MDEQLAFRMQLKPGVTAEYKRRHDELWPELADALSRAGIYDYSIFLDEETMSLFAVLRLRADNRREDAVAEVSVAAVPVDVPDQKAMRPEHPRPIVLRGEIATSETDQGDDGRQRKRHQPGVIAQEHDSETRPLRKA